MFTVHDAAFAATMSLASLGGAVLSPTLAEMTVEVGGAPMYPSKNIIENAINSKDHTTLVAAVKAAGGKVVMGPHHIETVGTVIYFEDTEGNLVGAMQYDPGHFD